MDKIFEISSDGKKLMHCSNNANDYPFDGPFDSGFGYTFSNAAMEFNENDFQESWSTSDFVKQHGSCTFADFTDSKSGVKTHGLFAKDGIICTLSFSIYDWGTELIREHFNSMRIGQLSTKKLVLYNPADFPRDFSLNDITVPLGVETIERYAFDGCNNIRKITIPNSVMYIENNAFANCTYLEEVIIPDSVKYIGDNAFSRCPNLERIEIRSKEVRISRTAFMDCPKLNYLALAKFEINDLFLLFPNPENIETIKILEGETIYPQQILNEHANRLLTMATYYHAMGMDLSIIQGHGDDNKSYKNPGICDPFPVSGFLNNQSNGVSSLFNQSWRIATGIGVCLGHAHIRAIDVDGIDYNCQILSVDENGNQYFDRIGGVLNKVLEKLGLPSDYPWVIQSGSQTGFHILFVTFELDDEIENIALTPNTKYCFNYNGPEFLEPYFNRMELLWNGHLVLPPSIHYSGNEYIFRHKRIPSIVPANICLSKLNDMMNHFCAQGVFTTYDYGENRKLELIETKKLYSEYDSCHGYICSTEYKEDSIAWLENCQSPDAYNSLAIRYVLGKGVPVDKKKAFILFNTAGDTPYARFNIASLIACGYFEGTTDDVEDYLQMRDDEGKLVDSWIVDGEDKFNLVRENAKKYAQQSGWYLFFDTETTGIPLNYKAPSSDIKNWPRLVQLGWILMTENGKKVSKGNYIIKPDGFTIPAEAAKIHKITTKMALELGYNLSYVIDKFLQDFNKAKYIVGHNIDFDKKIVGAELIRLSRPDIMDSKQAFCTMKSSIDFCKIPGYYGYKYPKLQELYHKLFGNDFEEAHNAASDIEATQQCFWELRRRKLI